MGLFDDAPYLEVYKLKEAPYSTKPDERFLYLTPTHKEAIATVGRLLREREGAALIYGKYGTGKTTVMRRIYSELKDDEQGRYKVGVIENAGHCPTEFQLAGEILQSFGVESHSNDRKGRYDQIKEFLLEAHRDGLVTVLLIDEVQEFPAKVLESLRGYLNFETNRGKIIQIVLFALPRITRKLAYAKTLRNRLLRSELAGMNRVEMEEMLKWRFFQAEGQTFPFGTQALDTLFELTKGHPRTTCQLASLALEMAAYTSFDVTPDIIRSATEKVFVEGDE